MKTGKLFLYTPILLLLASCSGSYPPMRTVDHVDLNRYLGTWYEIARLPNSFQEGCLCTTAEYELIDENTIRVTNTCRQDSALGDLDRAEGKAWVVPNSGNAKLEVSFFWPFKGDYWIIDLDKENYKYALVGTPSRKYLWILSRAPQLADSINNKLLSVAKQEGFDLTNFIKTEHPCSAGAQF